MEYTFDLHCHTIASDGALSIPELAQLARDRGLDALVITDHCRPFSPYFQSKAVLETLNTIDYKLPVPVILGAEIGTPYGEFLLFGSRAISLWHSHKENLKIVRDLFDMEMYWDVFKGRVLTRGVYSCGGGVDRDDKALSNFCERGPTDYAMFVCHPTAQLHFYERWPEALWGILHGFEIMNHNVDFEKNSPKVVDYLKSKINNPIMLKNSDNHDNEIGLRRNTFYSPIEYETLDEQAFLKILKEGTLKK